MTAWMSVGARHCLALFEHARLWIEGDACVAPTERFYLVAAWRRLKAAAYKAERAGETT
jgi:hypothetical protein